VRFQPYATIRVYDSGSRRGLEPCSGSSILPTLTSFKNEKIMIKLEFTIDEVNHILSLLGQLPFAASNGTIGAIVQQAQPQAEALEKEKTAAE
jgi:hypothetical protein